MKEFTLTFLLLFVQVVASAQTVEGYETKIRNLNLIKVVLTDSIENIDSRINALKEEINYLKYLKEGVTKKTYVTSRTSYMMTSPDFGAEKIQLDKESRDSIELLNYEDRKLKVFAQNKIGYMWPSDFYETSIVEEFLAYVKVRNEKSDEKKRENLESIRRLLGDSSKFLVSLKDYRELEFDDMVYEKLDPIKIEKLVPPDSICLLGIRNFHSKTISIRHYRYLFEENSSGEALIQSMNDSIASQIAIERNRIIDEEKKKREELRKKRVSDLSKKYDSETARKIIYGHIWIGMTKDMALESIGRPNSINRSVFSWGVEEQWVYENKYLYFDDGILTSYQD